MTERTNQTSTKTTLKLQRSRKAKREGAVKRTRRNRLMEWWRVGFLSLRNFAKRNSWAAIKVDALCL